MLRKLRPRSAYDVFAVLALFVALGGTSALALSGSNTVFSDDVANDNFNSPTEGQGGLVASDLRAGSVTGFEVADGSLTGADVFNNTISGADITNGSLSGADVFDNTIGGADITNGSLTGTDVLESTFESLDADDAYDDFCNPDSLVFEDCTAGGATITLFRNFETKVLVTAMTHFSGEGFAPHTGKCHLERNGVQVSNDHLIGEETENTSASAHAAGMQVTDVEELNAGGETYTFKVMCNQTSFGEFTGDIRYHDTRVSVVELAQD
jgi:hypothetical protein